MKDFTKTALDTLRNAQPAGDKAQELQELILRPNMTGGFHATIIDIPAKEFRGWNNQTYPLRGCATPRACLLQIGTTPSIIVMDGKVATLFVSDGTVASFGLYGNNTQYLRITRSDVNGKPVVIQDGTQSEAHFSWSRSGLVKLAPQKADPLAERKEFAQLGKARKQLANLNSAFSAWEQEVKSRAQQIDNLKREEDRHQEIVDATDLKISKLDGKIALIEGKIAKGRASADRMSKLTGAANDYRMSADGYQLAFDKSTERIKEIQIEIKALEKPVAIPEALKTLLG
jgi:hypothetical protein